jgi:hypothetical protein
MARSGAVLALFSLTDCDLAILPSQDYVCKSDPQILVSGTYGFA